MVSNPLFIIPDFFFIFQMKGSHSRVILDNAKKNLIFHFGVGRHASFPQKPVVNRVKWIENCSYFLDIILPKWPVCNLKRLTCASKRDGLALATIRYFMDEMD